MRRTPTSPGPGANSALKPSLSLLPARPSLVSPSIVTPRNDVPARKAGIGLRRSLGPSDRTRTYEDGPENRPAGVQRGKKRTPSAVARKLAVLLHRLWITSEVYDPLYNIRD